MEPVARARAAVLAGGLTAILSRTLLRADTTVELGVPTTRVARALHDIAPASPPTI